MGSCCFRIGVILTVLTGITTFYCNTSKSACQLEYMQVSSSKELHCSDHGSDITNHTWHYRKTVYESWSNFSFPFCNCGPPDCEQKECEVKNGLLLLRYGESEYEGFYKCSSQNNTKCFELKVYVCKQRQEPLVFKPKETVWTSEGRSLTVTCGADFGCSDKTIAGIHWEHRGEIINNDIKQRFHICNRKNITYTEAELIIDKVIEDDFHHPFVCTVRSDKSSEVQRFNVSLHDTERVHGIQYISLPVVIPCVLPFILIVIVCIVCVTCVSRWYPEHCFCILTHCSCLSRIFVCDKYKYQVFILHEQDDSSLAHKVKDELSSCGYNSVGTMEWISLGSDFTKEFKELLHDCASLLIIYPEFPISQSFDHLSTVVKQTIKPYQVSALVLPIRLNHSQRDARFSCLGFKTFVYNQSIYDQIVWRLPKVKKYVAV